MKRIVALLILVVLVLFSGTTPLSFQPLEIENAVAASETPCGQELDLARQEIWELEKRIQAQDERSAYLEEVIAAFEDVAEIVAALEEIAENATYDSPVTVKTILLTPKDYPIKASENAETIEAIGKSLRIIQGWFLVEIGATFAAEAPIAVNGNKTLKEYEKYPPETNGSTQANQIFAELSSKFPKRAPNTYYLVFLHGKTSMNWAEYSRGAVIGSQAIESLADDSNLRDKYVARGLVVHELGHVLGDLPDTIAKDSDSGSIMSHSLRKKPYLWDEYHYVLFPGIGFKSLEKGALAKRLKQP